MKALVLGILAGFVREVARAKGPISRAIRAPGRRRGALEPDPFIPGERRSGLVLKRFRVSHAFGFFDDDITNLRNALCQSPS
jgi:hypothetical protein